jgi:mono/diheme cytochrome c family protein
MHRRAIHTLFVAASLLLLTTACDKGGDVKADAKGETKKADEGDKADVTPPADGDAEKPVDTKEIEPADTAAPKNDEGEPAAADDAADDEAAEKDGGDEGGAVAEPKPTTTKKTTTTSKDDGKAAAVTAPKIDAKGIYEGKCKSCHGGDGKGDTTIGKKVDIPSLAKTSLSKAKIVSVIESGVPDTKMKGYKDKLSKEEIDAVADYVKKL